MKKIILVLIASTSLAGCNTVGKVIDATNGANNALARLAENDIPRACGIVYVAESFVEILRPRVSARVLIQYDKAKASVKVICDNPPRDVAATAAALLRLNDVWFTIQDATKGT